MPPSTIPTSFVPHSASASPRHFSADFTGIFSILCYVILAITFALAIAVFLYGRVLSSSQSAKDAALAQAEAGINPATVEDFVRLRDRLSFGQTLLEKHVAFSGFFASFGTYVPTTVRFSSLHLSFGSDGAVKLDGAGTAKNFNALANASSAFAKNENIKDAIFSGLGINTRDNSVSFTLSATLDPKVIAFSPGTPAAAPNMPTMTASTSAATGSPQTGAATSSQNKP